MSDETRKTYEVGYRKPPKDRQWKKGQSGNPAGRPRRKLTFEAAIVDLLYQRVVVRRGKTTKRITKLEQILDGIADRAVKGGVSQANMLVAEARKLEARAEKEPPLGLQPADEEVMKALYARLARDALAGHKPE